MDTRQHKTLENRLRREAKRKGLLLRRNRIRARAAENNGLYVLIGDSEGNRAVGSGSSAQRLLARRRRHLGGDRLRAGELPLVIGNGGPRPLTGPEVGNKVDDAPLVSPGVRLPSPHDRSPPLTMIGLALT